MSKSRRMKKIAARKGAPQVAATELRREFKFTRQGVEFGVAPVKGAGLFVVVGGKVDRRIQFSPA